MNKRNLIFVVVTGITAVIIAVVVLVIGFYPDNKLNTADSEDSQVSALDYRVRQRWQEIQFAIDPPEPIDPILPAPGEPKPVRPMFSRAFAIVPATSLETVNGSTIAKFFIDWSVGYAEFQSAWVGQGASYSLELVQPDSQVITQENYKQYPNVTEALVGDTYRGYRLQRPSVGEWQVRVTGPVDRGVPFVGLSVGTDLILDYNFDAEITKQTYHVGDAMKFLAKVVQSRESVTGARVELEVVAYDSYRGPGGVDASKELQLSPESAFLPAPQLKSEKTKVTLYDDGQHDDKEANDGVYGNLFNKTPFPGSYCFTVTATGSNKQGDNFSRSDSRCTFVAPR